MIFSDGVKKIGFFEKNIYRQNLETLEEFNLFRQQNPGLKFPDILKQELQEYLGYYFHDSDEDQLYIDKEFKKAEKEDAPEETAFKYMQEIINKDFNNIQTKAVYAEQLKELEKLEEYKSRNIAGQ